MGASGDCLNNAVAESFVANLKREVIHRRTWPTQRKLIAEVFGYIDAFYNANAALHAGLPLTRPVELRARKSRQ